MELYNPSSVALPALKISKIRERQAREDDLTVSNLLRSKLLLDVEFNALYLDILEKSKELLKLIRLREDELLREYAFRFRLAGGSGKRGHREWQLMRHMMLFQRPESIPKKRKKAFDEAVSRIRKELHTRVRRKVSSLSNKIQNRISGFEEKRKVELAILSSTTIHVCRKCGKIMSLDKFTRGGCVCGEKITRISQVKQVPVHHFNERLINFLEQNCWLEHGVDYLLRKKNFQTLVGYHVLGHSGVLHEVDNIADSKGENYRFFCECKTTEVKVNDIFVFSGKMIDVGCSRGYVFTTCEEVSSEIVRLARSKNIDIVKGVLGRETASLLADIRER